MKSYSKSKATLTRHAQAQVRLYARQMRSDQQQLELLEKRGADNCKEAQRLRDRINAPKPRRSKQVRNTSNA